MRQISILFFGSESYSLIVKNALIQAGYPLSNTIDQAELIVVADYGQKIPQADLDSVKFGGINLHPSLLPLYRGPTPVPTAILNKETTTGITIIKMVDKIDAGPILAQKKVIINPNDTSPILLTRCFTAGAKLLINILPDYLSNKITQIKQAESLATYTHKFTKQDGFISWEEFVKSLEIRNLKLEIERTTRALFPWPGVWTTLPNGKILKLLPNNLCQIEGKQPITKQQFLAGYQHLLQ